MIRPLSNLCPNSAHSGDERRQRSCESASSRAGPASRPTCCGPGSVATDCSLRPGPERLSALLHRGRAPGRAMRELLATRRLRGRARARGALGASRHRPDLEGVPVELGEALRRLDDWAAHAAIRQAPRGLLARPPCSTARCCRLLRELGEKGGRSGEVSIAQEHFASHLVQRPAPRARARLGSRQRPRAVLAGPPEERHDLGLLIFGLALREHGWRNHVPRRRHALETLTETVRQLEPDAVVLAATDPDRFGAVAAPLQRSLVRRRSGSPAPAPVRTPPCGPAPSCSTCHLSPRRRSSRRSSLRLARGRSSTVSRRRYQPRRHRRARTAAGRGTPL